ncbi:TlpA family protein disulfide reductase [Corynebacterium sp. 320]|uniref:TlpA family protein disulfide reductase n=1 Tax=Corynebacterium zhongnanshanii TaxID=2768834 RepID=A0ABQ6VJS4_9CORY|nr:MULTISPECIES: TlpA disulfide reductase family protein [Corynebacterium]KAB1504407.1 TlpA family protein disulfide reductase [Corynebacterium sp. 320]KAB1552494.1 TlpA family protein disulfide reductase [Corynebacterium sp. 321]KAB1554291.1 TlpA family protein disulfide reductase [Corynebacterium sp. 319]KAB3522736.1 TlpA family protein disulfide reductase [Corynebacterium zhongnanshanii]KAB3528543.1 TlpA family protein disulfide reductase [Corynebacterium sp. 250]
MFNATTRGEAAAPNTTAPRNNATPRNNAAPRRATKAAAAALLATATTLSLAACGDNTTAGTDAVAVGGTFEFVSPGGKTSISYPEGERKPIQNFSGKDLLDDSEISLSDFDGQIVVLNSWGQWCGPCRSESDDLQNVQEKLEKAKAGTILGINVKDPIREKAQDFVRDNGITYPSLYDPPFKTALALGGLPASVIPTTIVLDKQHRPAHVFLKEITDQELWDVIEPLIDEQPAKES